MYQVIHQGQPGITGSLPDIIAWAKHLNMQFGLEPVRETGFANFTVVRQDGEPLSQDDTATLQRECRYRPNSEFLAEIPVDGWGTAPGR